MAKISKRQTERHQQAEALVRGEAELVRGDRGALAFRRASADRDLTTEEREFVLNHWNPLAHHNVGRSGIFFTPPTLARDMMIETLDKKEKRVLDLCAGIGSLAYAMWRSSLWGPGSGHLQIVCIENNPVFVDVGKRVLPEAVWIRGDAFDSRVIEDLGRFDEAISNPPFGISPDCGPWLTRAKSHFLAAEVAMRVANTATFIMPQGCCPFRFSGEQTFMPQKIAAYEKWSRQTGIVFEPSCGIDTSFALSQWVGTGTKVEIVNLEKTAAEESGIGTLAA